MDASVLGAVTEVGVLEVAGPEELRLEEATGQLLAVLGRTGPVVADARAPFFCAVVGERALLTGPDAHLGHHTFTEWLKSR